VTTGGQEPGQRHKAQRRQLRRSDGDNGQNPHARLPQLRLAIEQGQLNIEDLGSWPEISGLLTSLADDPVFPVATGLLIDALDVPDDHTGTDLADARRLASMALADAVLGSRSPAIFMDCAQPMLRSPGFLTHAGRHLARSVLDQAATPPTAAPPPDVLRAADALVIAAQMRLADWADRWDLFALLADISGPAPATYARAVARAIVSCIETWPEALSLLPALRRLAGLDKPASGHAGPATPDDGQQSDFGLALARIAIMQALRAADAPAALASLDEAVTLLASALADDDRLDIAITADIVALLHDLLTAGRIHDQALLNRLANNIAGHRHLEPQQTHWIADRTAASHAAWSKLATQIAAAHQHLAEPSWYSVPATIDNIIDLYRTSRSTRAYRRAEDDTAVRDIIAPTLEAGFAANAALLRHLQDHVDHLRGAVDQGTATSQQAADLPTAILMRDAAMTLLGATGATSAETTATAEPGPSADRVAASAQVMRQASRLTTGNMLADTLLERARDGFAASPDYEGDVQIAADFVTHLLIVFIFSRTALGEKEAPYLYDAKANEAMLARDLQDFVAASGQLGNVRTEVRHIAGGRTDMEFSFPGFNLYVELKVDSTKTPLGDKKAYLGQSAAYQVADKRIGFLLVLRLLPTRRQLAPWLGDAMEVVTVQAGSVESRHVAAIALAGARTKPSAM
jgi:hypothetical protein